MCSVKGRPDLLDHLDGAGGLQRAFPLQQLPEVRPLDEPHRHVEQALLLARMANRHDVRVIQRRRQPRLAAEPLTESVVLGELGSHHLQRDGQIKGHVRRPVDDAHPALAEHAVDAVAGEFLALVEAHGAFGGIAG